MKLAFLHLSDLHINTEGAYCGFQIKKLIDSLRTVGAFDKIVIIVSGDIAFSGDSSQYNVAYGILNKMIIELEKQKIKRKNIEFICVPGNHDICFEEPPRSSQELNAIYSKFSYKEYLETEFEKQKSFFEFAKKLGCYRQDCMYCQKIIDCEGFNIEVNMLNTAIFSLKYDEDKGLHYIDQNSINKLNTPTNADFVISVLHHSYDWYIDSQKDQLEKALLCKSSLVFMGHEHRSGAKRYSFDKHTSAVIHAGGSLCNDSDWTNSEYDVGVLDTESLKYSLYQFIWDSNEKQYTNNNPNIFELSNKPSIEKKALCIR